MIVFLVVIYLDRDDSSSNGSPVTGLRMSTQEFSYRFEILECLHKWFVYYEEGVLYYSWDEVIAERWCICVM